MCRWLKFDIKKERVAPQEWTMKDGLLNSVVSQNTFRDMSDWVVPWHDTNRVSKRCGAFGCGGAMEYPDV